MPTGTEQVRHARARDRREGKNLPHLPGFPPSHASHPPFLNNNFQIGAYPYLVTEILLIYFFSYFWTTVVGCVPSTMPILLGADFAGREVAGDLPYETRTASWFGGGCHWTFLLSGWK